jgi:hypothetical protein
MGVSLFQTNIGYALMKTPIAIKPNWNGDKPLCSGSTLLTTKSNAIEKKGITSQKDNLKAIFSHRFSSLSFPLIDLSIRVRPPRFL